MLCRSADAGAEAVIEESRAPFTASVDVVQLDELYMQARP